VRLELVDPYSPRVETTWRTLEAKARPAYFLTWGWMENWLACLPRAGAPRLAIVSRDDQPIAACFVSRRRLRRHGVISSRAVFINATGDAGFDELCLEHNALLAAEPVPLASLVELLPGAWDELFFPAADGEAIAQLGALDARLRLRIDGEVENYVVDLEKVRADGYVPLLGPSTRAQVRKAQRQAGEVTFEVARDEREAMDIYEELVALHQRSWRMRGQPGAFADPWFDRFHRRLIAQRFRHGELQLIRVSNRDLTIGCLYNFVSAGRVLFYQCGFGAPADRHIRPGYLCHTRAVEHCAAQGLAIYDLLGGGARYKKSLATDVTKLVWARVQRKQLWFEVEDLARAWLKGKRR
jgi:hypothetical protein